VLLSGRYALQTELPLSRRPTGASRGLPGADRCARSVWRRGSRQTCRIGVLPLGRRSYSCPTTNVRAWWT